ncbi:MAG: DUF6273 domain-containing protein [Lachnospiraceae bacterium]|nr:DUF6273 domain-containing protein [Lachnospiraceae bacterium]
MKKKLLAVMLVATMTLSLGACNLLSHNNEEPEEEQVVQEAPEIQDLQGHDEVQEEVAEEEPGEEEQKEEVADDENADADDNADAASGMVELSNAKVGDVIVFGAYDQDGDDTNGAEPIEWEVLEVSGNRALLISKYVLDAKAYNEEYVEITWENCTLRSWLNGEFYDIAFNGDEQSKIAEVTLSNPDNEYYGAEGGNDTNDKVFLLSMEEILKYYGNDWYDADNGYGNCKDLIVQPTQTAINNCVYSGADDGASWWLRSPGYCNIETCNIESGSAGWYYHHYRVDDYCMGVRPAIYVEF